MSRKLSVSSVAAILFVILLLMSILPFLYTPVRDLYANYDVFFMLFGQFIGGTFFIIFIIFLGAFIVLVAKRIITSIHKMKKRNKLIIATGILILIVLLIVFRKVAIYTIATLLFPPDTQPLAFTIHNEDVNNHMLMVEVFNSNNKSLFNKTYEVNPGESIESPAITKKKGKYTIKVILDGKIEKTSKVGVSPDRAGILIEISDSRRSGEKINIFQAIY